MCVCVSVSECVYMCVQNKDLFSCPSCSTYLNVNDFRNWKSLHFAIKHTSLVLISERVPVVSGIIGITWHAAGVLSPHGDFQT